MYQMILFDLDGTLTDPKEGITKSVAYALKAFSIEADVEQLTCFIGPPLKESFIKYYGLSDDAADQAIEKYRERYKTVGLYENKVYEGITERLEYLKSRGKRLAVATSKPYVFAKQILDRYGLSPYFDWIVGSELDGTRGKKAEVIEEVLRQAGVTAEQCKACLMVGDRMHDIEGAKACHIASLGVQYGYAQKDELQEAGADYIVADLNELKNFFKSHC